ncbi:MAG: MarR family transcriptional regulator [Planctomycetota bacterium]|nr:MarR family transcriptional regulator [Planctomycetota bacterium]
MPTPKAGRVKTGGIREAEKLVAGMERLSRAIQAIDQAVTESLVFVNQESGGLSLGECHFLETVEKNFPANALALGEILGLSKGGVSRLAARLRRGGLVEAVQAVGDRKSVYWHLTPRGEDLRRAHAHLHHQAMLKFSRFLAGFSPVEIEKTLHVLNQSGQYFQSELSRLRVTVLKKGKKEPRLSPKGVAVGGRRARKKR